jgi:hypothetical protein
VSPNCAIGGEPARIFTVTGDLQVDSTTFDITCAHANGSIAVYTALPEAAGPGPFTVTLDGVDHRSLGPIDSTRFTDLADGAHLLVIDGVNLTTNDRCLEPVHSLSIVVSGGTSMPDTITGFVERASFGCD